MKKMILILLMLPLFVFSQNRIEDNENYTQLTLKDGRIIECIVQSEKKDSITYYSWIDGGVKTISKDLITDIKGKRDIPDKERKKISKEMQRDRNSNMRYYSKTIETSERAGDYLEQAGNNYLAGVGLGIAGGGLAYLGTTNPDDEFLVYVGAGLALSGFVCTLIGHTKLIKAGKALNQNKNLSFHPSTSGLGLALKF